MALNAPRASSSYNVPPSQNTAPVLEFRCLYTHDFFKKQKKWHDGSLKFHTFNRRVMVYDDVKNYIGDLHYRHGDEFGEGLELQLDRGVKVEVGEPLGQTQTDLTPLLDKGRAPRDPGLASNTGSAQNASARAVQRIATVNSQGKPKSLVEVLGASQGRIGRARPPLQSPYEQKQALAGREDNTPPSKRQRISAGKENVSLLSTTTEARPHFSDGRQSAARPDPMVRNRDVLRDTTAPSVPALPLIPQVTIDVSSDEDVRANHTKPRFNRGQTVNDAPSMSTIMRMGKSAKAPSPDLFIRSPSVRASAEADSSAGKKGTQNHHRNIGRDEVIPQTRPMLRRSPESPVREAQPAPETSGPMMRPGMVALKMIEQPPRRKLMYKALLPSSRAAKVATPVRESASNQHGNFDIAVARQIYPCEARAQQHKQRDNLQHAFELDEIEQGLDKFEAGEPEDKSDELPEPEHRLRTTPMFFSQESSIMLPPSPPPEQDDFDFGVGETDIDPAMMEIDQGGADGNKPRSNAFFEQSPNTQEMVTIPSQSQKRKSPLFQRPDPPRSPPLYEHPTPAHQPPAATSASNTRSLRRVVSENDSPSLARTLSPSKHALTIPPPTKHQPTEPITHTPPKKPIQRAQSDTTPLNTSNSPSPPLVPITIASNPRSASSTTPLTVHQSQNDQGPWSKLEAFLLFETWPAAKEKDKPVYPGREGGESSMRTDGLDEYDGFMMDDGEIQLSIDASARAETRVKSKTSTGMGMDMSRRTNAFGKKSGIDRKMVGIRSARSVFQDEM